jgi:hypothetical protein
MPLRAARAGLIVEGTQDALIGSKSSHLMSRLWNAMSEPMLLAE